MVTAKLVHVEKNEKGNMKILVNYKVNGFDFPTNESHQGIPVIPLWIGWWNIIGKTTQQVVQWVKVNVEHQADNLIKVKFKQLKTDDLISDALSQHIGSEITREFAIMDLDTNNDGLVDKQVKVFDDGTFEEVV